MLKKMGHKGISISHYVFDRGPFASIHSLLHARHRLYHERRRASVGASGGHVDEMEEHSDWVAATGCAQHDLSNALKWAHGVDNPEVATLKALHICIESLRNTTAAVLSEIPLFIAKHARQYSAAYQGEVEARSW